MLLAVPVGLLLVAVVLADVFRTVLLPVSSGWVGRALPAVLRRAVRAVPARWRRGAQRGVGPLALALTVATWLLLLVVGFALLYLPVVEDLAYAELAAVQDPGIAEALYLSGASLTTLGFGDVVGSSTVVRLLTVSEAACGLAVLTATLGYLPAIYTLVSDLRTANQRVSDLGAASVAGAAELVAASGTTTLELVRREVLAARQHLQRFPVLHDFSPPYDESVVALARGATGLWLAGHFARDGDRPLGRHLKALEQALRRLTDELHTDAGAGPPVQDRARQVAEQARRAAVDRDAASTPLPEEAVELLARLHADLDAYAAAHGYPSWQAD